jgi:hypothetical protein
VGKRTEEKLKASRRKKKEILKEAAKIKTTIFSSKSLNACKKKKNSINHYEY